MAPLQPRTLTESVACLSCGYDLKGLDAFGTCPECGFRVQDSLAGPLLRNSSAEYLRSLSGGALLLCIWSALLVPTWLPCISALTSSSGAGQAVTSTASMVLAGVFGVGAWLLCARDPGLSPSFPGERDRRRLRMYAIAFAALTVIDHVGSLVAHTPREVYGLFADRLPMMAASIVRVVLAIPMYFFLMFHVRWLARRAGDRSLRDMNLQFTWLVALLFFPGCALLGLGAIGACILLFVMFVALGRRVSAIEREADERRRIQTLTAS